MSETSIHDELISIITAEDYAEKKVISITEAAKLTTSPAKLFMLLLSKTN